MQGRRFFWTLTQLFFTLATPPDRIDPMAGLKCRGCTQIYDVCSAAVVVDDLDKLIKKKQSGELQNFYAYISGLRNEKGGAIVIHAHKHEQLEQFDQKVDNVLNNLIPDGSMYHDVYDRNFFNSTHLVYRVKPSPRNKPKSTVDFHSKTSNNKGRADPTHQQMQILIEQLCENPTPDHECRAPDLNITFVNKKQVSFEREYGDEPFQESINIQAKALHTQPKMTVTKLVEYCWKELKVREYISAFTKIKQGGVVYLGVSEHKTVTEEWESALPACNTVVKLVDNNDGEWGIWRHAHEAEPPDIYYVAKKKNMKTKESKTGEFRTEAIKLSDTERTEFRQSILKKVQTELKWVGEEKPRANIVRVIFHDVSTEAGEADSTPVPQQPLKGARPTATSSRQKPSTSTQTPITVSPGRPHGTAKQQGATGTSATSEHCVIEIQIGYYHGICFYDKNGPLSYKCQVQKSGFPKPDLKEIDFSEWVNSFKEKAAEKLKDTLETLKP